METSQSLFYLTSQQHFTKLTTSPWNMISTDFPDTTFSWFSVYSLGVPSQSSLPARLFFYPISFFNSFFKNFTLYYIILFFFKLFWDRIDKSLPSLVKQKIQYDSGFSCLFHVFLASENIYIWNGHKSIYIYIPNQSSSSRLLYLHIELFH